MYADDSDTALVGAARNGDREAFTILLARHRPLLLALCQRALGDAALAEDAAQEAAIRALLDLDRLHHAEKFGSWLSGIGLNICRIWLRDRSREQRPLGAPHPDRIAREANGDRGDPSAHSETVELAAHVQDAVEALPDGQRAAVRLFYLADLTYAETADQLGIGVGTVRTRLYKARVSLRKQLSIIGKEEGMTTEGERKEYICSFCGKRNSEVERMIAGPKSVIICDECVDLCNKIIAQEKAKGLSGD